MSAVDDAELRDWIDRLAIQDLIYRYSDAVTRADWEQAEDVFAPDAIWESPVLDMRFESARAFLDFLSESTAASELLIQTPHCPVIRLRAPDRAEATTTIHEWTRGRLLASGAYGEAGDPINFEQYGIYYDDIARLNGAWRFTHRLFAPIYIGPDCVTGQVPTERTSLLRPT